MEVPISPSYYYSSYYYYWYYYYFEELEENYSVISLVYLSKK